MAHTVAALGRRMVAVVSAGLAVLGIAGGALAASNAGVTVSPQRGSQHSTFTVSFTARDSSGQHGSWVRKYVVGAVGPRADGCRAQADTIPNVRAGQRTRVRLAPRSHREPGPIMIGPAGPNMFGPGPAHMCAGR